MPKKINGHWEFTDEELDQQLRTAELAHDKAVKDKPIGVSYSFRSRETRILSIRTEDGSRIDFSVSKIRELQNAPADAIRLGYITRTGNAIHWDNLDAHYTIAGLAAHIFGTKEWMRALAAKGGQSTSVAKGAAARINGRKGGRPRRLVYTQIASGHIGQLLNVQTTAAAGGRPAIQPFVEQKQSETLHRSRSVGSSELLCPS